MNHIASISNNKQENILSFKEKAYFCSPQIWRRVRVAEGARLESVYRGNSIGGSNPPVSAKNGQMV
jgi:hypothetical protein